jgi:hypothetical protein
LQFRGQILAPRAEFDPATLPCPAVLLEDAGSVRIAAAHSRYSFERLWILWRFDTQTAEWSEIVRTTSRDASWTLDVAPIAHRLLYPPLAAGVSAEARSRPTTELLAAYIDEKLAAIPRECRAYVLAELERHLAAHIVRATDWMRRVA